MSAVSCQEAWWVAPRSTRRLSYRLWRPESAHRLLLILHGFGEHSGRYAPLAAALAAEGFCVAVADLWGHGRSGGRRGDVGAIDQQVQELQQLTAETLLPQTGQRDYVVFGHSFGGLLAIRWAMNPPDGLCRLIVQSPLLEVGFPLPIWKTAAAKLLASVWPTARLSIGLDVRALSHDQAVVQAYRDDPLVHNKMSARTYRSLLGVRDAVCARAEELRVPTLLLCGGEDRVISLEVVQRWFDRLRCEKRAIVFPGCFHELHHEPVQAEILRFVRDWGLG